MPSHLFCMNWASFSFPCLIKMDATFALLLLLLLLLGNWCFRMCFFIYIYSIYIFVYFLVMFYFDFACFICLSNAFCLHNTRMNIDLHWIKIILYRCVFYLLFVMKYKIAWLITVKMKKGKKMIAGDWKICMDKVYIYIIKTKEIWGE